MTLQGRNGAWIGVSEHTDSRRAARLAAEMALERMGTRRKPGWALAFCGGSHQPDAFMEVLRSQLGGVPIVGGAAFGTITGDLLGNHGFECAVAVFPDSLASPEIVVVDGLDRGERKAGRRFGQCLRERGMDRGLLLLLYGSIRSAGPPLELHVGSLFLDGVYEVVDEAGLRLVGAGAAADQFRDGYIFDGRRVVRHAAVGVRMPLEWEAHITIMHGCVPVSSFRRITRIEGPVVYEIDGRPALKVLAEMLGSDREEDISLQLTLGEKYGDPYAPYDEMAYVNRLIIGVDRKEQSVRLFEADFQEGARVQIMSRDNASMLDSARSRTRELLNTVGEKDILFGLYLDCGGRSSSFCGAEVEEAEIVRSALGPVVPLLGFYSGVEIAPFMGRSRPLDWTGVLALFTEGGQ